MKVSVAVIVKRPAGPEISLAEWTQAVTFDPDLRLRVEPYEATNPRTGEVIRMNAGEADAELRVGERWVPLLSYSRGRLTSRYLGEFDDPGRAKIAALAKRLQAVITTDASDDPLNW
jgi:hypothetical protein